MKSFFSINKNFKKGFTLTELIIVVIVISVLVSFILPRYTGMMEKTKANEAVQLLSSLYSAQKSYAAENVCYYPGSGTPGSWWPFDMDNPTPKHFGSLRFPPAFCGAATPPNFVAELTRTTGAYKMLVFANSEIQCSETGTDPGVCKRIGY